MDASGFHADDFFALQDHFHEVLRRYFSGALFSNRERILEFAFNGKAVCRRHAKHVVAAYEQLALTRPDGAPSNPLSVRVESYAGDNALVLELAGFIQKRLAPDLVGAYLHGSLAMGEEIAYSDCDALLVLKDDLFRDENRLALACWNVLKGMKIVAGLDPLQHHGFFVLTQTDLEYYRQPFYPLVLWDHTCSLLTDQNLELQIHPAMDASDCREPFDTMARAIRGKVPRGRRPANYYRLKALLSEFMLLPALYLQAKGRDISKKESFPAAAHELGPYAWEAMEAASRMRSEWDYAPSLATRFLLRVCPFSFAITLSEKRAGRRLSPKMKQLLTEDFFEGILRLILAMERNLDEVHRG
jgi:hypothetical protein